MVENEKNAQLKHLIKNDDEFEIDLRRMGALLWKRRIFAVKSSCGLAALFLGIAFVMPKTYESTAVVQTSSPIGNSSAAIQAMAAMNGGSGNVVVDNYIALMKSRAVIEPIVASLDYKDGLFRTAEEKKKEQ